MEKQNQIKLTLSRPEAIEHIDHLLNTIDNINRTKLADKVCEDFNFINPLGGKQRAGCLRALRELEGAGKITLPQSLRKSGSRSPQRLSQAVPSPQDVPLKVGAVRGLALVLVEADELMQLWNELMIRDHPRGASLLVGRQIRYLIGSEHGWLGAISFSSSAYQLEDRDKWIGWPPEARQEYLHYIVNMSRFLIRSEITCKNLASKVLSMVIRQFPDDYENRYGYRPLLLETFVDKSQYTGTCYQAANWQLVGQTKGRGRLERFNKKEKTVKDIYVYPLEKDFRLKMGGGTDSCDVEPIEICDGLDSEKWAKNEFADVPLGDKRLTQRLIEIATEKAQQPGHSYSAVVGGNWPKVKAYYRLIDHPDDSQVTMGVTVHGEFRSH